MSVRPSLEKADLWRKHADAAGLSLSAFIVRCVDETIAVIEAAARADAQAVRQGRRLAELDPLEVRERSRYADWTPGLEDEGS